MVQQVKLSVWTAAISSSARIGQPIAFNSPATVPVVAGLVRFLAEMIWQSLPETWRHPAEHSVRAWLLVKLDLA